MATRPNPREPLLAYLRVQEKFDREMYAVLRRSVAATDAQLKLIVGKNIGAVIRREQLLAAQIVMHEQIAAIMERAGLLIRAGEARAAAAAIETFVAYDRVLFTATGASDAYLNAYLRSAKATAASGIEAAKQRMLGTSYIPLSQQVYNTQQLAAGQVDRFIETALARGLTAREFALEVAKFIRPDVRGGVSYAAMRLGRTEINNAFHAKQAEKARETPWTEAVQWNLSGSHPKPDECNEYAEKSHFKNGPPGYWLPADIPHKPHPHCLCFTTPVTVDEDEFLDQFFAGAYDPFIDLKMGQAGYSPERILQSRVASRASR